MTAPSLPVRWLLLAALCCSCGADEDGVTEPPAGSAASPEQPVDPRPSAAGEAGERAGAEAAESEVELTVHFSLADEAAERGLEQINHCGDPVDKRYLLESIGQGVALLDFDGDGWLDVYLVDGCGLEKVEGEPLRYRPAMNGQARLYRNLGEARFEEVSEATGTDHRGMGSGANSVDYDGDGDADLFVTAWGPNLLYRNEPAAEGSAVPRRFTEVGAEAGLADPRWSCGSCWLDGDRDGDLDLYVANYLSMDLDRDPDCWRKLDCPWHDLTASCGPKGMVPEPDVFYRNRGDGSFEDATEAAGFAGVESRYGLGVVALDQEVDGDLDVYVANDSRGNFLFLNDGEGSFEELADLLGASLNRRGVSQAGMGVGCGDPDGDGDDDLFLTNFSHDYNTLYRNDIFEFMDVTRRVGFDETSFFSLGWGTEFIDLDNDSLLELYVANGHVYPEADQRAGELAYRQLDRLYFCRDEQVFDISSRAGPGMQRKGASRGMAVGDLDNDGDQDLVVVQLNERPSLLINHLGEEGGHFLQVLLRGQGSNPDAIGARVEVHLGPRVLTATRRSGQSFLSGHDPRLHFGLGESEEVDLVVHWPSGAVERHEGLAVDRRVVVREGQLEVEEQSP